MSRDYNKELNVSQTNSDSFRTIAYVYDIQLRSLKGVYIGAAACTLILIKTQTD